MAVVSGGTTLIDNGALDAGVPTGSLILLETQTASASASIEFTSGIDSTYDSYMFKFYNIHPATDAQFFQVNFRDGSTAYDATKTSTYFESVHDEADSEAAINYKTAYDLAQSTSAQYITRQIGNGNDECASGTLTLYNPSSTTFVKHFIGTSNTYQNDNKSYEIFTAGYCNVTAAIDGVQFSISSGNIDDGIIKMYGVV
jgi:hypothetical protein